MIYEKVRPWKRLKWMIPLLIPSCCTQAGTKDVHVLAGIAGYSGGQPVTISDVMKGCDPALNAFFPARMNKVERFLLEKCLCAYAEIASGRAVSSEQVAHALSQHLRKLRLNGVEESDLLRQYKQKSMEGVKQVLAAEIRKKLQVYHFLQTHVLDIATSFAEVKALYEHKIAVHEVTQPPSLMVLQLTLYPQQRVPLTHYLTYLQEMHKNIARHATPQKREQAFKKAIRTCFHDLSSACFVESSYLSNQLGAPYLTAEEIPARLQEVLYQAGVTDIEEGLLSPPYTFTEAAGRQGVRMVFVKKIRNAHPLSLAYDYPYIFLLCNQESQKAKFMEWVDFHKKELVYWV